MYFSERIRAGFLYVPPRVRNAYIVVRRPPSNIRFPVCFGVSFFDDRALSWSTLGGVASFAALPPTGILAALWAASVRSFSHLPPPPCFLYRVQSRQYCCTAVDRLVGNIHWVIVGAGRGDVKLL